MMKQLTIVVDNKTGRLADVAEAMSRGGVNIMSISAQAFENNAVFRILTPDSTTAMNELNSIILLNNLKQE